MQIKSRGIIFSIGNISQLRLMIIFRIIWVMGIPTDKAIKRRMISFSDIVLSYV
jgi:hypothetical protein